MQNPRSRRCRHTSDIIADSGFCIFSVLEMEFQSELSMTCIFYIFFEKVKKFYLHFSEDMVLYFLCYETRGCSSMVEHQPSKLDTWVRFPSPAFFVAIKHRFFRNRCFFICSRLTVYKAFAIVIVHIWENFLTVRLLNPHMRDQLNMVDRVRMAWSDSCFVVPFFPPQKQKGRRYL